MVPTVDIFSYRTEWVTRRFGRSQSVEHADLLATGWILGEFRWTYYARDQNLEGLYLTALLDRKERDFGDRNCAAVVKDSERGLYRVAVVVGNVHGYEAIATAIHHMAGTAESHRAYLVDYYHPGIRRG